MRGLRLRPAPASAWTFQAAQSDAATAGGEALQSVEVSTSSVPKAGTLADQQKRARDIARKRFEHKTVTTADGDKVMIPWQGIKHGANGQDVDGLAVLLRLPDVLAASRWVGEQRDNKATTDRQNIAAVHTYRASVVVDGRSTAYDLIVREHLDGKRYYDHAEKSPAGIPGEPPLRDSTHQPAAGSGEILPQVESIGTPSSALESAETGPFGPVYSNADFEAGIDALLRDKTGEIKEGMFHPSIGPVDVIYGEAGTPAKNYEDGYGLAKIAAKHPEVYLHNLADQLLRAGDPVIRGNTATFDTPDYTVVVKRDWKGSPKDWLLTAFEPKSAASGSTTIGAAATRAEARSGRDAAGADSSITQSALESTEGGSLDGVNRFDGIAPPRAGEAWFHGRATGERAFADGRPAFFARDRESAGWYAQGGGTVTQHAVNARNPASDADLVAVLGDMGILRPGTGAVADNDVIQVGCQVLATRTCKWRGVFRENVGIPYQLRPTAGRNREAREAHQDKS